MIYKWKKNDSINIIKRMYSIPFKGNTVLILNRVTDYILEETIASKPIIFNTPNTGKFT